VPQTTKLPRAPESLLEQYKMAVLYFGFMAAYIFISVVKYIKMQIYRNLSIKSGAYVVGVTSIEIVTSKWFQILLE
jgi:hypothetical protein